MLYSLIEWEFFANIFQFNSFGKIYKIQAFSKKDFFARKAKKFLGVFSKSLGIFFLRLPQTLSALVTHQKKLLTKCWLFFYSIKRHRYSWIDHFCYERAQNFTNIVEPMTLTLFQKSKESAVSAYWPLPLGKIILRKLKYPNISSEPVKKKRTLGFSVTQSCAHPPRHPRLSYFILDLYTSNFQFLHVLVHRNYKIVE